MMGEDNATKKESAIRGGENHQMIKEYLNN